MDLQELRERVRQGDRLALARALTLIAQGEDLSLDVPAAPASRKISRVIAITGGAGVGKSTLIGKLIELLRNRNQTVAVLACDPQSPLTGGALLGDRFRMPSRPDDPGLFIRSLAVAGGQGAVAEHLDAMVELLKAFRRPVGFDWILLETVGAGQGDTAVHGLADAVVLLLQPEAGDDIQWEKAGLLEIADLVVIHKADLPGAERVEAQVRSLLNLPGCREIPVLGVSAVKNQGLEELVQSIDAALQKRRAKELDPPSHARLLLKHAQNELAERFGRETERLRPIVERWRRRELDDRQAAGELLRALSKP